ncbi:MAG: cysteine--tRNA ligase [Thaumarchaeota archaeon]|jgi:cysteinyl-tRNA synthetase|nr:cysteine--tRNA ligase [Candidatus Terraquivivens yellowstonensis]MCL7387391.1 cysteine--tRNA ligase [Candidatus Terraquivivens yellowstonensis]MCL7392049.1 cysteine--tRNA ligase [Candidatus Terraquivivens yellowstonensis]MCL7395011.1 cysteine--tRNA ligase [Candidatus Terraquivivens yellowstonensis]MCL7399239.1 cysteine--tRNA ligase [Candidatus Terraquivivens yellowstonensis]
MGIKVYNTLTRRLENFEPFEDNFVKMYVCGPTVQDVAHLGHARTYIAFDAIIRFLEYRGYRVFYVRNITDVGHIREESGRDRILEGADREKLEPMELVDKYMLMFFEDMDALKLRRPNIQPRATMHILDMIEMTKSLIEKGYAYEVDGNVYFDVSKFPDYGKLSGIKYEELIKHRIEPDPRKRNPADFALWKKAEKGYLLKWPSIWGEGFPGWHIECSVMSMKYLGPQIDIHGGGQELILPHHENEIAQSEAFTGKKPFVKYWLHTGYLTIAGEKMSKSLGNFVTIREVLKKYDADAIRFFVLSSHYRSNIDYNEEAIKRAADAIDKIKSTLRELYYEKEDARAGHDEMASNVCTEMKRRFIEAMEMDFNTPEALSVLHELIRKANAYLSSKTTTIAGIDAYYNTILELCNSIGLLQGFKPETEINNLTASGILQILLNIREELRKRGMYDLSDRIRESLKEVGIIIEDTKEGQRVRLKR